MEIKETERKMFKNVRLTVSKHRNRRGCDICKKDTATECFIGFVGNILWICPKCFKKIINTHKEEKQWYLERKKKQIQ